MVAMAYRHREGIDSLPSYKQGKPAPAGARVPSYKISSNENPYPPLESVRSRVADQALTRMNRYPDMRGTRVVERLAALHGVEPDNIQLGCGSTEVITQLVDLVAGPGDEVVYPWRSFEAYPIIVACAGAASVQVPLTDEGRHDIDAMIAAVNDRTRLVIVNNPNNPTATPVSRGEADRLVRALPADVLILFDEAYVQFNDSPDMAEGMDFFPDHPNVVVARTFSKAYGLAGLRIGYAVAAPEVVEGLGKVALPFGVTDVAQVAALASLDAQEELDGRVKAILGERARVLDALRGQGWRLPESRANFFWLPFGEGTRAAADRFAASGLSVRAFPGEGIRVTIGEGEANDRVIEICRELAR